MSKSILLVGPICSGKTSLAKELTKRKFIKNSNNVYGIEQSRRLLSDGTMAGELDAWASFLRQIQSPPAGDNAIYEFSGTGRHVYSVSWAMNYSVKQDKNREWVVAYCLASNKVIEQRYPSKKYDAPMPFNLNDPLKSLEFMNNELFKSYNNAREWNSTPKLKFDMNVESYSGIAKEIEDFFNR